MKKVCMITAIIALVSCQANNDFGGEEKKIAGKKLELTEAEQAVAQKVNGFAFDLIKATVAKSGDNVLVSPLSASYALAMINNGAAGATEEEIRTVLGFGDVSNADMNSFYSKMTDAMQTVDPDVSFESANSIWIDPGFPVYEIFKITNTEYYNAEIRNEQFDGALKNKINDWCSDKTHGKITDFLKESPAPPLCLINALYFKGAWTLPFDKELTKDETFHNADGSQSTVAMMNMEDNLNYTTGANFKLLELPYGNESFAMELLLPNEGVSIDALVESLDADTWSNAIRGLQTVSLPVKLPRFKVEYERSLKESLQAIGLNKIFSEPDFSRISDATDLYVKDVLQKTCAEVNENGTEAAAVTVIQMCTSTGEPYVPPTFYADRPFLYLIREKTSGVIFFAGVYNEVD
ncbi:MAG: serpin family protein [Tannerella sp.]|jgi:serpin B|nr:serpin family protein [Tannerella sp.]